MNDLQIFSYKSKQIRTVLINEEPWWVAKDVCDYFGDTDHKRSISRLDDTDKKILPVTDSLGRNQSATCVNESGLYSLLFNFQPEKATKDGGAHIEPRILERLEKIKKFKKWITSEVLPSIRKTGQYSAPKSDEELILIGYEKLMQKVKALTPKADAYDKFLSTDGVKDMAVVAQELFGDKIGKNTLFKKLRDMGILKPNNQPYQQYMQYFKVIPIPKPVGDKIVTFDKTYVNPKGMDYIAKRFNLIREAQ